MRRLNAFSLAESLVTLVIVALVFTLLFTFYGRFKKRLDLAPKQLKAERECARFLKDLRLQLARRNPLLLPEREGNAWIFTVHTKKETFGETVFVPALLEIENQEGFGSSTPGEVVIRRIDFATRDILQEKHFSSLQIALTFSQKTNAGTPGPVQISGELTHQKGLVLKELFLGY